MDRRTFLLAGGTLAASIPLLGSRMALAQGETIRIGLMAPLTGVVASGGREMVDGFQMYFAERGGKIAGHPVEIIVEDDGANPDMALQKARRLVEQSKVHFLFGNLLANTGLAVANYVESTGTPYFIPIIAADDLTQRHRIPNVIRVAGYSASHFPRPLADWALKQGYRKAATISQDYTFGHEQCGGFSQVFRAGGGEVLGQFWHPLNTSDFSSYLGQLGGLGVDVIFAMETGADATRFMQQYRDFGLKGNIPLIGAMNMTDQSVIRTMGDEVEGVVSAAHFAEGSDNPVTKDFVARYEAAYKNLPSLYGFAMYSGAMWIEEALKSLNGDISDTGAFLGAVAKTELTGSPLGTTVKLDSYGNPIYDVVIRSLTKRPDGKFWNEPIAEYPGVSQFWTYDPEEYLRQPPFSRDYQG